LNENPEEPTFKVLPGLPTVTGPSSKDFPGASDSLTSIDCPTLLD
tara:strand:- start:684 stop:818 length:135 start_codon:yes stop_codon:yes gene_type:complete